MNKFGHVHVGLWMKSPDEAEIMIRAIECRLRALSQDDRDRPMLQEWRRQAMNMTSRSATEEWTGWEKSE